MGIGITIKSDDEAGAAELIWLNNRHFLPVNFYVSSSASATKSLHIGLEHIFPTRTNNSTDAFVPALLTGCLPALHALWGGQVKVLNRAERTFTIRYMKDGEVELNIGRRNAAVLNRSTTQKPTNQNPMTAETTNMLPNRLLSLNQHLRIIP